MKHGVRIILGIFLVIAFCIPLLVYSTQQLPSAAEVPKKSIGSQSTNVLELLHQQAPSLNYTVLDYAFTALQCATQFDIEHNNILTIIDYSLPASEKRLWVFDLAKNRLLFHTYVSHGLKTGALISNLFSNRNNSRASSVGLYKTLGTYYGREGISLRLMGLENGFNDNAENRTIVMHGGWYVNETFIQNYGRPGRSWGCPSLPKDLTKPILETIKNNSLLLVYYPEQDWLIKSQFLHCSSVLGQSFSQEIKYIRTPLLWSESADQQEHILYVDLNHNKKHEENEPIVAISANTYSKLFSKPAPVSRMLRRQLENTEYVAITGEELQIIKVLLQPTIETKVLSSDQESILSQLRFVIPEMKEIRGYYQTLMKSVDLGKVDRIETGATIPLSTQLRHSNLILFLTKRNAENRVHLEATDQFIRWIGL